MLVKKIAVITAACLVLGALTAAPVQAGLGGCGNSGKSPVATTRPAHTSPMFDALRWIVPGRALDVAMAWIRSNDNTSSRGNGKAGTEGLGGCFGMWGLGGCKL